MKLKTIEINGQTYAEISEDKPVFVHPDGKEIPFDVTATLQTITRLNGEARSHREAKEAAEERLKSFEGVDDAEAARKALETVKNIKDGELIQAGKVEEIKVAARKAAEEQIAAQNKAHAEQLAMTQKERDTLLAQLYDEKIGGAFSRSKFISEKAAIPADLMQARFGSQFKIEEGKVVAYDQSGNRVYSRAKPGDIADFDEALEALVDQYPYKNAILKGTGNSGSGARQSNGGDGGQRTLTRAEFDALAPIQKQEAVASKIKIVDAG